jgi:hypothetical protein
MVPRAHSNFRNIILRGCVVGFIAARNPSQVRPPVESTCQNTQREDVLQLFLLTLLTIISHKMLGRATRRIEL